MDYSRYMTHLRYLALRYLRKNRIGMHNSSFHSNPKMSEWNRVSKNGSIPDQYVRLRFKS